MASTVLVCVTGCSRKMFVRLRASSARPQFSHAGAHARADAAEDDVRRRAPAGGRRTARAAPCRRRRDCARASGAARPPASPARRAPRWSRGAARGSTPEPKYISPSSPKISMRPHAASPRCRSRTVRSLADHELREQHRARPRHGQHERHEDADQDAELDRDGEGGDRRHRDDHRVEARRAHVVAQVAQVHHPRRGEHQQAGQRRARDEARVGRERPP